MAGVAQIPGHLRQFQIRRIRGDTRPSPVRYQSRLAQSLEPHRPARRQCRRLGGAALRKNAQPAACAPQPPQDEHKPHGSAGNNEHRTGRAHSPRPCDGHGGDPAGNRKGGPETDLENIEVTPTRGGGALRRLVVQRVTRV